ncbi:MAG: alpha-glucan family phosphorylase [Proteobacteria bacterium]|nr:alpha-glucan family phosphorylase [Pseudomonadota bacterium]
MTNLQTFQVFPKIPEPLSFLEELIRNFWWCWHLDAIELFRRINPALWNDCGRNPIVFSTTITQERLQQLAEDNSFLAHQKRVRDYFEKQVYAPVDRSQTVYGNNGKIAYFSMEFGIHESLPLFAGGLGVLAGDHLKASSDMGLPLVGVGILFRNGYFHQYLNHDGWQQEEYPETNLYHLPVERAKDNSGNEIVITVDGPHGKIHAVVWKIMVGRIPLYLLDTNMPLNSPETRLITASLYAGDSEIRLAQEILLGIGGMRALQALDIFPEVCHLNEGHCSFLVLERLAQTMEKYGLGLKHAKELIARSTVFTTHTPVAAGHDDFPVNNVRPYIIPLEKRLGVSSDEIISWGQHSNGLSPNEPLSMFVLGLHMAQYCNGVSELHGKVARKMWKHVWKEVPEDEIPITHVTNGAHIPSWISIENSLLFERYLGPDWYMQLANPSVIMRVREIYEEELWRAHEMSRSRLIRTCRKLMLTQHGRRNAPKSMMKEAATVLDPSVLTIGFARRFATYKRANLLLHDVQRLEAIISSKDCPVQFIFSGKAHPKDNEGKELIQRIIQFARNANVRNRIVFLENYDINISRHLIQGVDIWLNNPRRPFEACGTSGIKAAANGVLNLSVLDGWWCEGYSHETGWGIGNGEEYEDYAYQDAVESHALYNILENDVIPLFYDRGDSDIPVRWVAMMKASMEMAMTQFSAQRMVGEYEKRFYQKAAERRKVLVQDNFAEVKRLSGVRDKLMKSWNNIQIGKPVREAEGPFRVGESLQIKVTVFLGDLIPEDVEIQLYYGLLKSVDDMTSRFIETMNVIQDLGAGKYLYDCRIHCKASGRYGFTARVKPREDDFIRTSPGLMKWALPV